MKYLALLLLSGCTGLQQIGVYAQFEDVSKSHAFTLSFDRDPMWRCPPKSERGIGVPDAVTCGE